MGELFGARQFTVYEKKGSLDEGRSFDKLFDIITAIEQAVMLRVDVRDGAFCDGRVVQGRIKRIKPGIFGKMLNRDGLRAVRRFNKWQREIATVVVLGDEFRHTDVVFY